LAALVAILANVAAAPSPAQKFGQASPGVSAGTGVPSEPAIVSREMWRAKPALPGMKEQQVRGIILHHTAVRKNFATTLEAKMRGLQSFSQSPGQVSPTVRKPTWADVPYHFYVDVTGRIGEGRSPRFAGDTNTKYDTSGYIQVVLEGDFEKETVEPKQLAALRDLLLSLMRSWRLGPASISVHKQHASTSCPGRNFIAVLPALIAQISEQRRGSH
jgi:hypothetical protein